MPVRFCMIPCSLRPSSTTYLFPTRARPSWSSTWLLRCLRCCFRLHRRRDRPAQGASNRSQVSFVLSWSPPTRKGSASLAGSSEPSCGPCWHLYAAGHIRDARLGVSRVREYAMEILGFDHIQLAMPRGGEAQARSFYGDALRMTEITKPKALQARGGVWFTWGAVQLHLGVQMPFTPATKAHPGILVRDFEAVRAHCPGPGSRLCRRHAHSRVRPAGPPRSVRQPARVPRAAAAVSAGGLRGSPLPTAGSFFSKRAKRLGPGGH